MSRVREYLKNKFVLFDTNIISFIHNNPPEKFEDFLKIFEENNCTLCINSYIKNEFLFSAKTKELFEKQRLLLIKHFSIFSTTKEKEEKITRNTFKIHRLYCAQNQINPKQMGFVDCINAAFLYEKPNELLLATTDLKDYPLIIFERKEVFAIDLINDVITIGILKINIEKFNQIVENIRIKI